MSKRENGIALIDEINKRLKIKPIRDDRKQGDDYTRVQVRKFNTLIRIKSFLESKYKNKLTIGLNNYHGHSWLDVNDYGENELFITYHL